MQVSNFRRGAREGEKATNHTRVIVIRDILFANHPRKSELFTGNDDAVLFMLYCWSSTTGGGQRLSEIDEQIVTHLLDMCLQWLFNSPLYNHRC